MRKVTLNRREKDSCVEDEAETRRQSVSSFSVSRGQARWATQIFLPLRTCPQRTTRAPQVVIWRGWGEATDKLQGDGELAEYRGRTASACPGGPFPSRHFRSPASSPSATTASCKSVTAPRLLARAQGPAPPGFLASALPRASPLTWQLQGVGVGGRSFENTNLTLAPQLKPFGGSPSMSAGPTTQRDGPLAGLHPLPHCPSQRWAHSDPPIVFPLRSCPS